LKKSLLVLACVLSSQAFASHISITIDAHNEIRLDKKSKTSFSQRSSLMTGSVAVLGNIEGQDISASQAIPAERSNDSNFDMNVVGKNLIYINDKVEGISGQISAQVKKSFGGTVKSINLSSKDYEAFYAESLENTGLAYLKQFGVSTSDGEVKINYELSDFVCKNDKKLDLLQCDQDIKISISFSDEVKGRNSILGELDKAIGVIDSYSGIESYKSYDINSYIQVLNEINSALSGSGYKPEFSKAAKKVAKIKDYIESDIVDSRRYSNIDGSVVIGVLNEIKSALNSAKKTL